MLSILIPIYNFNVVDFIKDLKNQADSCGIEYEILCIDDFSNDDIKKENEELGNMEYVFYEELPKNIGRSKIRNKLAQKSQFPYLLFLDCDSKTVDKQFVKRYINSIDPDKITYGGRCYESQAPKSTSEYFRWWYGMNRETISVAQRKKQPYHSFMTNNFLIPKTIFNAIKLDEQLVGYGHEDTLFGLELKKRGIEIQHIDNPLCHIGLENFEVYIAKTEEGISNLKKLIDENKIDDSVKLFRYYKLLKKIGVEKKILNYYRKNKALILQKLQEKEPNLRWFNLYKLGYLISLYS
ncbi:MAG: glycosyltransferase [Flavobacteriales bacterium]|nr:glycosyltransferase [Flavobacteriales bacterium]MCB9335619.1 glycosyltransferase [Flavobacteriales bacterium]